MKGSKLIAVYDTNGSIARILAQILRGCGRSNYRLTRAQDCPGAETTSVILICEPEGIEYADRGSVCVINYAWADKLPRTDHLVTFSPELDDADFTAHNIRVTKEGRIAFEIVGMGIIGRVRLGTSRKTALDEALAAATAAIGAGIPFADVLAALERVNL